MEAKVGVLGAAEVNGPLSSTATSDWSLSNPSTWALIIFAVAVLYLVVL